MDNFSKLPKMQCFKEGGSVQKQIANYEKRERKSEDKADVKQDKAIVKKAFGMHDKQEHGGEHTDLSKLRKGGRAKKTVGTVNKYKSGGAVENVYTSKKTSTDDKNIAKTKAIKPSKVADPSAPVIKPKNTPAAFKKGGKVKKMAAGGSSIDEDVRSRAMKWIESGSPDQLSGETPTKSVSKKAETKLYPPDMTIEEADRQNTEYENKRESERLARRYPEKRSPGKTIRDEAEIAAAPTLETKGKRLLKSSGIRLNFKKGGKIY